MLKNFGRVVGSHVRDVLVCRAVDNRVFITVPLYFEKDFVFQSARVECGELIITGKMPTTLSNTSHQLSASSEVSCPELR